jgi:hypothetical protein
MELKSHNGVYLGSVAGTEGSRSSLAAALGKMHRNIADVLGVEGEFGELTVRVIIRNGQVHQAIAGKEDSFMAKGISSSS